MTVPASLRPGRAPSRLSGRVRRLLRALGRCRLQSIARAGLLLAVGCGLAGTPDPARADDDAHAAAAQALRAAARSALSAPPTGRSMLATARMKSSQAGDQMQGELFDEVEAPLPAIASALASPQRLCDLLYLHLNLLACRASAAGSATGTAGAATLQVSVGTPGKSSGASRFAMQYQYRLVARSDDYVALELVSPGGPLGTSGYAFEVQAASLGDQRSALRMTYAYRAGMTARIALDLYNKAAGRQRVGFTVTGQGSDGQPTLVGGLLGSLERNLVRYYFALCAYVGTPGGATAQHNERRLQEWFRMTEQYPRQLHEVELADYLAFKQGGPAP